MADQQQVSRDASPLVDAASVHSGSELSQAPTQEAVAQSRGVQGW